MDNLANIIDAHVGDLNVRDVTESAKTLRNLYSRITQLRKGEVRSLDLAAEYHQLFEGDVMLVNVDQRYGMRVIFEGGTIKRATVVDVKRDINYQLHGNGNELSQFSINGPGTNYEQFKGLTGTKTRGTKADFRGHKALYRKKS